MADPATAGDLTNILQALLLGGLMGMVGQSARAVAGLKKMNDAAQEARVSAFDFFLASRLLVSLLIGFIAGVAGAISLGLPNIIALKADNLQLLLGLAAAGYAGTDFIEAFAKNVLAKAGTKVEEKPKPDVPDTSGKAEPGKTEPGKPVPAPAPVPIPVPLPGPTFPIVGRMSTFGGPDDTGVAADEGLAILEESDLSNFREFFLPAQPPGTSGMARRLNPETFYIACRWDYDLTPRRFLKTIKVQVANPATGKSAQAQPVDWGPHVRTGRTADLSPGLAHALGLETDQECRVVVPIPQDVVAPRPPTQPLPLPQPTTEHPHVMRNERDIRNNFGDFDFVEAPNGHIKITGTWARDNIVTVTVDELKHVVKDGKFECHKAIAPALKAAFAEVGRRGLTDRILTWEGCFVPRHISRNPAKPLSRHSWAIAFDINAQWNGYGNDPKPKGEHGSVVEIVPIFESFGFAWGGFFRPDSIRDGMHFEYSKPVA